MLTRFQISDNSHHQYCGEISHQSPMRLGLIPFDKEIHSNEVGHMLGFNEIHICKRPAHVGLLDSGW